MSGGPTTQAPDTSSGAAGAVRAFLWSPFSLRTWRAVLAVGLGLFVSVTAVGVLSTLFSLGGSLLFVLVGIPIIGLGIEAARVFARVERWRMAMVDERPLTPHPYRPFDTEPREPWGAWVRQWAEAEFLDGNRWLDVLYVLVALPLTIIEFTVAVTLWSLSIAFIAAPLVVLAARAAGVRVFQAPVAGQIDPSALGVVLLFVGLLLLPVAASVTRGLVVLHRAVVQGMLCVDPADALRRDVERLRDTRSAALEVEASELRRIERDLHDGAQQRLVMLAIDLGMAEERLDTDPAAARRLVVDAREQARQALAELREVVRGVAPSILVDRGLVAAIGAVAGRCPVPSTWTAPSTRASGSPLRWSVPRTTWWRRRWPTSPSTAGPRGAACSSGRRAAGCSSRSATTGGAVRLWRPAAGWPGCVTASRPSTARSRSSAHPAARRASGSRSRSPGPSAARHRRRRPRLVAGPGRAEIRVERPAETGAARQTSSARLRWAGAGSPPRSPVAARSA